MSRGFVQPCQDGVAPGCSDTTRPWSLSLTREGRGLEVASGVLSAMTSFLYRGSCVSQLSWCVCKRQTGPAGLGQLKPLGTALLGHKSQMQVLAQPGGQTGVQKSKTRGTMPCSVRDRRLPPAPRCTLRQCYPGLRPSAQPRSEAPAAQVCVGNGLGGTFLPPWEHCAHEGRRVP